MSPINKFVYLWAGCIHMLRSLKVAQTCAKMAKCRTKITSAKEEKVPIQLAH